MRFRFRLVSAEGQSCHPRFLLGSYLMAEFACVVCHYAGKLAGTQFQGSNLLYRAEFHWRIIGHTKINRLVVIVEWQ